MKMKVKGFFKGMKYISHIFVYKEPEMQIGTPTDVKHIAHIGWDSSSMHNPSWMNEFNSDYVVPSMSLSSTSFGEVGRSIRHSQASGDFGQQEGDRPFTDGIAKKERHECQKASKNKKRKKTIKISSPPTESRSSSKSESRSSSKSSRSLDSYATALEEADDTHTQ